MHVRHMVCWHMLTIIINRKVLFRASGSNFWSEISTFPDLYLPTRGEETHTLIALLATYPPQFLTTNTNCVASVKKILHYSSKVVVIQDGTFSKEKKSHSTDSIPLISPRRLLSPLHLAAGRHSPSPATLHRSLNSSSTGILVLAGRPSHG
jgi:hypothetical protein